MLRPNNLVAAARHFRYRALQLRFQLRHFQHREALPLPHPVPNVHVNMPHEAGNLGMNVHHLVGLELSRQRQHLGDIAALHHSHLRRRWTGSSFHGGGAMMAAPHQYADRSSNHDGRKNNPKTLAHIG